MFQIILLKGSSTNHRRSSNETSMFRIFSQQKNFHQYSLRRNHQGLINVYSKNHQQRLITPAAMKHQNLMISTLEILMIKNVCIQIFVVSSGALQSIINGSSRKKQWNVSDSEVNTTKTIGIKRLPSKLPMFQLCLSKESSTSHRRSSNETSTFPRLSQRNP